MGELAKGTTDAVVFRIVRRFLDTVAAQDGSFTVSVIGFVGGEIDLAEEPMI